MLMVAVSGLSSPCRTSENYLLSGQSHVLLAGWPGGVVPLVFMITGSVWNF